MKLPSWSRSAAALAERLFGGTCYLCRGDSHALLCAECVADLPFLERPRCPQCALPSVGGRTCGRCMSGNPAYDATCAVFAYAFPADVLVRGLKFDGELALATFLADALRSELGNAQYEPVDLVIPVPLHDSRLR